jgi:hypothetical protein
MYGHFESGNAVCTFHPGERVKLVIVNAGADKLNQPTSPPSVDAQK